MASEQERLMHPGVWLGHKGCRPSVINQFRQAWSVDDATVGTYVCMEPGPDSEYVKTPGFEVARLLHIHAGGSDEASLDVEWMQFDP